MVESYYLPSFAITISEKISKGSARSIKGVNIIELLRSVSDTLIEAGGHPMAAGFSLETKKINEFTKALTLRAEEIITDEILERFINIDMLLPFELIDRNLYKLLQELSPFGMANPEPVFATKNVEVMQVRKLGKDASHLKLQLEKNGKRFDAIGFGMAKDCDIKMGDKINIAYVIDENEWNGKVSLQLKIRDIQ
jgi:single-stranded-DNA-specific exonuclease